ncbi:type II toxin-antitoxin system HicA family toxin [Brachybacterium sp. DNPG3]
MKYRDLAILLRNAGFISRQGKGDHEVWTGPTGTTVVITQTRDISPGLVRRALKAIDQEENR